MPDTPPSLLLRLRDAQDAGSWQRFFKQYWRLIFSFVRKCGLQPSDAQGVVQEVVTEVFRAMPRFEYDRSRGTFRAWLRTITQHKVADHLARKARPPAVHLRSDPGGNGHRLLHDAAGGDAQAAWERDWRRNLLQLCLDRVRAEVEPKTYHAFELYALQDWSAPAAAEFLKMNVASVYAAKSRVIARRREWAAKEEAEDSPNPPSHMLAATRRWGRTVGS